MTIIPKNRKRKDGILSLNIRKDKVNSTIRDYGCIGIVLVVLNLAVAFLGFEPYETNLLAVVFISILLLSLSLGIMQKSRICATGFMAFYLFDTIVAIVYSIAGDGFPLATLISMFFVRFFILFLSFKGTKAVYVYHKFIKKNPELERMQK